MRVGKALPFLRLSLGKRNATSSVVRLRSFSTTLFPSPQAYPSKFGMSHGFSPVSRKHRDSLRDTGPIWGIFQDLCLL
jgi:hypothetical protein